ncbi:MULTISPECIES: FdtA/QdtA family cupin domain-containing protein [unclassified Treponema]|uniref:sugar 3,4-ketoisomerase n=1 Tax=unclassified Treponema TaxID=2638727 RepID=UPI0020A3CBAD|nr:MULTISPECIES: FdtA/QdtA family cupin domain-containing protein [unclassified Treponema]UTC68202.1 WxcM-like domain-containing protein [Treponema sp. OMZ 789]UTC70922.1 WxcM-like domain-containing protein [Treponema sp. OMZ 790]UTC73662.1 WxcM-like domain-containing protein [Treponema sp. OMZ 791]
MPYSIEDCKILNLTKGTVPNLTRLDNRTLLPFDVKRIYYLYGIPENQDRGAHAHKELFQLLLAASGSFKVELGDGSNKKELFLNKPSQGLLIVPGIWRNLMEFSFGSVALVLASEYYTEDDYIRSYDDFLKYRQENV